MLDQLVYPSFSSLQGSLYRSILCGQVKCFEGLFEPGSIVERWIDVWLRYKMTCSILSSGISQSLTGQTLSHSLRTRRKQLSTSNLEDTKKTSLAFQEIKFHVVISFVLISFLNVRTPWRKCNSLFNMSVLMLQCLITWWTVLAGMKWQLS